MEVEWLANSIATTARAVCVLDEKRARSARFLRVSHLRADYARVACASLRRSYVVQVSAAWAMACCAGITRAGKRCQHVVMLFFLSSKGKHSRCIHV